MGSYTVAALVLVTLAVLADLSVLGSRLLLRRGFWAGYAIVLAFQLLVNGALTAPPVVSYDPAAILGPRLAYAPVEDVGYGFALILLTASAWAAAGRSSRRRNVDRS